MNCYGKFVSELLSKGLKLNNCELMEKSLKLLEVVDEGFQWKEFKMEDVREKRVILEGYEENCLLLNL